MSIRARVSAVTLLVLFTVMGCGDSGNSDPNRGGMGWTCTTSADCASGYSCLTSLGLNICTVSCSRSTDCSNQFGKNAYCSGVRNCMLNCSTKADCPGTTKCDSTAVCGND